MLYPRLGFDIVSTTQKGTEWVTLLVTPKALTSMESLHWAGEKIGIERLTETPDGVMYRVRSSAPIVARSAIEIIYDYSANEPLPTSHCQRHPLCPTHVATKPNGGKIEQVWSIGRHLPPDMRLSLHDGTPIDFEIINQYDRGSSAVIRTVRDVAIPLGGTWFIAV